jgi:molecular chaperone HscB
MRLDDDDFALFGLPRAHALDADALDRQWRALQASVHPDRFAAEGPAAQRLALQWAMRVNEAYRRLKDPMRRAAYLCELQGAPVNAENNTAMPAEFLMRQMAWREALDDADGVDPVQQLLAEVEAERGQRLAAAAQALDQDHDAAAAVAQVRALMFIDRLHTELEDRLEALQTT